MKSINTSGKKNAVVDIDNTLWQFSDPLYERLKKINTRIPGPEYWTGWEFFAEYINKKDFHTVINEIHAEQDHDDYQPYPEARGFLEALRKHNYHITIASHRLPAFREQTTKWLSKHGLKYDLLHLSSDKTTLFNMFTAVVVDDAPHILEKAVESGAAGAGLLFPWNRDSANNGFRLFGNLDEVLHFILNR